MRKGITVAFAIAVITGGAVAHAAMPGEEESRFTVTIDASEAEAALGVLATRAEGKVPPPELWAALFESRGYQRLRKREEELGRAFSDDEFRTFLLGDSLVARAAELRRTLDTWKGADLSGAAAHALAYLPASATIQATIYPMIKPQSNSFVFEVKSDPAIFLYLDPEVSRPQLENTLAHELHHIGYGTACPGAAVEAAIEALPSGKKEATQWIGAFGEGFAMLAAAGGPDVHPHAGSPIADRQRWDADVEHAERDLRLVEEFFLDLVNGKLSDPEEAQKVGFSFFGVQGPWYTVGWVMASTIERVRGRAVVIESFCDLRKLLPAYNDAARTLMRDAAPPPSRALPLWSDSLLSALARSR